MDNSVIIDRRKNPRGKNLGNRNRFVRRVNDAAKEAVKRAVDEKNIQDIGSEEYVTIPAKDIEEPTFGIDSKSGERDWVLPGNEDFVPGDMIPKPNGQGAGGPGGNKASEDGKSEDDFQFVLSREEFMELFFEDCELPDMVKKDLKTTTVMKHKRAGYTNTGNPANLDIEKSYKASMGRRIALRRPTQEEIDDLQEQIDWLKDKDSDNPEIPKLEEDLEIMIRRSKQIPFLDDIDMRYRLYTPQPVPSTSAVMICIMDVSASMDSVKKDWSKRFFMLLYTFLQKHYEKVDIVFVSHHSQAKEVSEEEFFNNRESGGTVVSTGLEMADKIIKERYPPESWNIYIAQASDGDNFDGDNPRTLEYLETLLNIAQYYAYVEVHPNMTYAEDLFGYAVRPEGLWNLYTKKAKEDPKLQCKSITTKNQIWSVFKALFEKKKGTINA